MTILAAALTVLPCSMSRAVSLLYSKISLVTLFGLSQASARMLLPCVCDLNVHQLRLPQVASLQHLPLLVPDRHPHSGYFDIVGRLYLC